MRRKPLYFSLFVVIAIIGFLSRCGSKPFTMADLPIYPGAQAFGPGESMVDDALANNIKGDPVMRKILEPLPAGGKLDQKGFILPVNAQWEGVLEFYNTALSEKGFQNSLGSVSAKIVAANPILGSSDAPGQMYKTTLYLKGEQLLGLVMVTFPAGEGEEEEKELLISLVTR